MTIDEVIYICLTALFKEDIFGESLYLKGGQALRIKEQLKSRFSSDIDFSMKEKVEDKDLFFSNLHDALYSEFLGHQIQLFDFTPTRRPKIKKEGSPDFWGGWQVTFKLISSARISLDLEMKRKEAIIPEGSNSPAIKLDISEYEYCEAVEKVKIGSVSINVYSRVLLVLEKIRAICQQHPDYELKGTDARARDYFDIERLWNKVVIDQTENNFIKDCKLHLPKVFSAKNVDTSLMKKIFEPQFIEIQRSGWSAVQATVSGITQDFEYYNDVLKRIIDKISVKNQE